MKKIMIPLLVAITIDFCLDKNATTRYYKNQFIMKPLGCIIKK